MIATTCISDSSNRNYGYLFKSCKFHGINFAPKIHSGSWSSHRLKDKYVYEFLNEMHEEEIILFVDGYDSIFISSEAEILNKYINMSCDILFSAEINCYPHDEFINLYGNKISSPFKYLNSGAFIGKAGSLKLVYEDFILPAMDSDISNFKWSNQYIWTQAFLSGKYDISLDYQCQIFQTFSNNMSLFKETDSKFISAEEKRNDLLNEINSIFKNFKFDNNKRLVNTLTKTTPCHLHFNSPLLKDILQTNIFKPILNFL